MTATLPAPAETPLSARAAGPLFPIGRNGKPRDPTTVARYIRDGIDVRGRVVRLEGGRSTDGSWWTTAAAVSRFLAALTAAWGDATPSQSGAASDAVQEFERLRAASRKRRKAAP